jgi:hypothetical protein
LLGRRVTYRPDPQWERGLVCIHPPIKQRSDGASHEREAEWSRSPAGPSNSDHGRGAGVVCLVEPVEGVFPARSRARGGRDVG